MAVPFTSLTKSMPVDGTPHRRRMPGKCFELLTRLRRTGHAVLTHFTADLSESGCHRVDDTFRPSTPRPSREVESALACRTQALFAHSISSEVCPSEADSQRRRFESGTGSFFNSCELGRQNGLLKRPRVTRFSCRRISLSIPQRDLRKSGRRPRALTLAAKSRKTQGLVSLALTTLRELSRSLVNTAIWLTQKWLTGLLSVYRNQPFPNWSLWEDRKADRHSTTLPVPMQSESSRRAMDSRKSWRKSLDEYSGRRCGLISAIRASLIRASSRSKASSCSARSRSAFIRIRDLILLAA